MQGQIKNWLFLLKYWRVPVGPPAVDGGSKRMTTYRHA